MDTEMDTTTAPDGADGRRSLGDRIRARPLLTAAVAVVVVGAIAFVLVWFQPQALLFDTVVDEEFPVVAAEPDQADAAGDDTGASGDVSADDDSGDTDADAADAATDAGDAADGAGVDDGTAAGGSDDAAEETAAEPTGPVALASGSFTSLNRYTVTGTATTFELEDGARMLRLEDFESTNGPDLFVYLTRADAADGDDALGADAVDLGVLTGNIGNQNYAIPADVDLDVYDTVVIWCLRFTTAFGAADLT